MERRFLTGIFLPVRASEARLARALRRERPDLPILVVSGYAEEDGIDPGLARLNKPFRNAEQANSLSALLPVGRHKA